MSLPRRSSPLVLMLLLVSFSLAVGEATAKHPNIVFILADDMGYGDVQALNTSSKIPTPNLNRLAAEGMTFTDAHSPSGVCTPTRYGVVTGRYCWRTKLKRGVLNGYSPLLIDPARQTVAGLLKANGYHTAAVGKWHLGLNWARKGKRGVDYDQPISDGPTTLGFDFFYGIPASLDMPPYVYVRGRGVVEKPTASQERGGFPAFIRQGERSPGFHAVNTLDELLGQALGYIRRRAETGKPFLLYFPLTAPHKPVSPHARFRGKTSLGPYGDFVVQVDWTVGQVLDTLKATGVEKDTLVFFTSDNGSYMYRLDSPEAEDHVTDPSIQSFRADHHTPNHVFRGTKADIWEGGHHVPFLARWPGKVKPGSQCHQTICLTDFMATCAAIVGAELPAGTGEDSFSLLPLLEGKGSIPRAPVIHHSGGGMFAIREGKWKLVLGNGSGGRQRPRGKPFAEPFQLFDLSKDLGEQHVLTDKHPQVVQRLIEAFEGIRAGSK